MVEYAIVLPTHWSPPFVALGERLESGEGLPHRIRVIKSWGLKGLYNQAVFSDGQGHAMYLENPNPEWKDVVLNYTRPRDGGLRELMFADEQDAMRAFLAINASWQLWLGGIEERLGLSAEQKELLYGGRDLCVSQSAA